MLKIEYLIEVESFLGDTSLLEKINRFRKFLNSQPEFSLRSAKIKYKPLDYTVHYNLDIIKETHEVTTFQLILYTKQKDENYIQNLNALSEN
ncbi:MAG: hypothetical protein DI598_08505, partial [Pseudopedobacter saltans]